MNSYFAFESVKRSLSVLPQTNTEDVIAYFSKVSADAKIGNPSKSKKILSEQEMVNILKEQSPKAINIIKPKPLAFTSMENLKKIKLSTTEIKNACEKDLECISFNKSQSIIAPSCNSLVVIETLIDSVVEEIITDSTVDMVGDFLNDSLGDLVGDSLLPIPVTPVGILASLLGFILL